MTTMETAIRVTATGPGPERLWRDALAAGDLTLPFCLDCGRAHFYPRVLCPHCGSNAIELRRASGRGTVYSTTVLRRRPQDGGNLNIALVDFAEGPRMMSRIDGIDPEAVAIGLAVEAAIVEEEGAPVVVFRPVEGA
ncbi:Zn-ribbon domain-containing OB-fold protein [Zavarzinia compransoris]|uniref:Zn-ribbon domain-containing OB-fold protein n=1 Tax=Zavarzinia marina TaxID=2911065 RepID=UPI001F24E3C4|nr:Zn-ribbon domain-containing OB-fold protein [Zavarzinia marina]MCF4167455.1 Zn-ribbon domain-containing OB-fold protein [Zavarzinia marina]